MGAPIETICAPSTPPGRGGVGIIRISGPLTQEIAKNILGKIPQPRYATFAKFINQTNDIIDEGIALFFPAPNSFTGEDILELQGHGGPAVINALLKRITALGARLARPGEFSERAFLNNKLDLTQAEAIADLIDATSEQAAKAALRSLQGEFSKRIQILLEALIYLRKYVEAAIDFVEEEINFLQNPEVTQQLTALIKNIEAIEVTAQQGSLLRDGITAVIIGAPNVGKSSLLNQLSGKDSAIVTDIPGTTRDILREYILIDGMPMHIIDTAGLRESNDVIEQEGMRRAKVELGNADIILYVEDATTTNQFVLPASIPAKTTLIKIRNKIDLTKEVPAIKTEKGSTTIYLSAKLNLGIDLLKNYIKTTVGYTETNGNFSARRRHLDALRRSKDFLLAGQLQLSTHQAGELLAEDLRQAQQALSEITGQFTADDLLGEIFSSFCVGK